MSDLKPLREALASCELDEDGEPLWRSLIKVEANMDTIMESSVRNPGWACWMGYQCRHPEIDALAASNAELLEAIRNIQKHYKLSGGPMAEYGTIYTLCERAITNAESIKEGV